MVGVQRFAQTRADDVCVDFRGGEIGVAQHGLHAAQVGPAFQEVSGKGMPQNVGGKIVENTGLLAVEL